MSARVCDLFDDVVWSTKETIASELIRIFRGEGFSYVHDFSVLVDIVKWAGEESAKHKEKANAIRNIMSKMDEQDIPGVTKLYLHHKNIQSRYNQIHEGFKILQKI